MIWHRVMVSTTMTLHELHRVLQVAMGWEGIHLYAFDIYAVQYGSFELMMGSPRMPLAQFSFRKNNKFSYTYDMGDGWVHEIRIESICAADPKKSYPLGVGGSGACPPEECGGPRGNLERCDEADGYGAWQDFGVMAEWLDDLTKRLEILGIRVHCLALGSVDLTSSAGKLTMGVTNAFAQWPSASSATSEPYPARVRSGPIPS